MTSSLPTKLRRAVASTDPSAPVAPTASLGGSDAASSKRASVFVHSLILDALLLLVNSAVLVAAAVEFCGHARGEGGTAVTTPTWELALCQRAFLGACVVGACFSVASTWRMCSGLPPLALGHMKPLHLSVLQFLAMQFVFEALMSLGGTTAWELPNAARRPRLVYPLRYATWASTNSYVILAVSASLRMSQLDTLRSCAAIVLCTLAAFPLELTPVGSLPWALALAISCSALALCLALVGRHVGGSISLSPSNVYVVVMSATFVIVVISYCSFGVAFVAAQLCGGGRDAELGACLAETAGKGCSCLTVEAEVSLWRFLEVTGKVSFLGVIVFAAVCTAPFPSNLLERSPTTLLRLHSTGRLPWSASALRRFALIAGLSVAVGCSAFTAQHLLLGGLRAAGSGSCGALCTFSASAVTAAVACTLAVWTFVQLLRLVVKFESLAAINAVLAPPDKSHGFRCVHGWGGGRSAQRKRACAL